MFIPVILAGGSGSRLWPLSRNQHPKQFLSLDGRQQGTMLQTTLSRLQGLEHGDPLVVTNEQYRFVVAEQLQLKRQAARRVILEPLARNTAAAIALAALEASRNGADPVLLVLAADHYIKDEEAFREAVRLGAQHAEVGRLVTFGIRPSRAETGFGYIHCGEPVAPGGFAIGGFREKPAPDVAEQYVHDGSYLWNSGIFMFRASVLIAEMRRLRPDILEACQEAWRHAEEDAYFLHVDAEAFARCDDESVDYAVMEHTQSGIVLPLDAGWDDLGSWAAIWGISPQDEQGNSTQGDVMIFKAHNTLVRSQHRLVAAVGTDDLIIVETKDAVLVAHRDQCQLVKQVVQRLQADSRDEHVSHPLVSRPWGHYDTVDRGERYQVKRITVLPGECLSLQLHYHRAEHWIVVSGTAKVVCGDKETILTENQSTYIPLGVKHSLSNPGKVPLELIEVQSGAYLGEDDIVRFEDRYGRVPAN